MPDARPLGGTTIPIKPPPPPTLSTAAAQLLADAGRPLTVPAFEKLVREPSRPGAEVLAFVAATESDPDAAELAMKVSTWIAETCDRNDAVTKMKDTVAKLVEASRADGYAKGWAAGQAALKAQLPSVVRETTFISDAKGQIVGKTEREFQTIGGKST
jgi:hypothetical protein